MEDMPGRMDTNRVDVIDMLTDAWKIYGSSWLQVLTLVAVLMTPLFLFSNLIGVEKWSREPNGFLRQDKVQIEETLPPDQAPAAPASGGVETSPEASAPQEPLSETLKKVYWGRVILFIVLTVLGIVASLVKMLALCYMADDFRRGAAPLWYPAVTRAFSKLLDSAGTAILSSLILIGLAFLLLVPSIIYSIYYSFAQMAVAFRGRKGMDALSYSKSVATGSWWKILGVTLVAGLLVIMASLLANGFFGLLQGVFNVPILSGLLPMIAQEMLSAFSVLVTAVLFFKLEASKNPGLL